MGGMRGRKKETQRTTLSGDDASVAQGAVQELEVRFLEQRFGRPFGVRGVGDDDVKFVLLVREELEAVADVRADGGVLEADGHAGEVFLGEADDGLFEGGF